MLWSTKHSVQYGYHGIYHGSYHGKSKFFFTMVALTMVNPFQKITMVAPTVVNPFQKITMVAPTMVSPFKKNYHGSTYHGKSKGW